MALRTGSILAAALASLLCLAAPAAAQEACSRYELKPSDTLAGIAAAVGIAGGGEAIYEANRAVLPTPDIFIPGTVILIPCADGSLPGGQGPSGDAAPASPLPPIRFLTGGRYAPFTDRDLPGGGMFTEMVRAAVELGDPRQEFRIDFVNDWGAHLTALLPSGAFDMGFPWYLPDCSRVANLSPGNAVRCTDYNHSEAFFEAAVGYYALADGPFAGVRTYPELLGARLCRPRGWFTFDLEANRLVEPNVTLLSPQTQTACWDALVRGDADVVTFDALPAEADLERLGLPDRVVKLEALTTNATLHVLTPKANPSGEAYLEIIDRGLAELRRSGRWEEIVARHLGPAQAAKGAPD